MVQNEALVKYELEVTAARSEEIQDIGKLNNERVISAYEGYDKLLYTLVL